MQNILSQHLKGCRPQNRTLLRPFPPTPLKSVCSSQGGCDRGLKRMRSLMEKAPRSPLNLPDPMWGHKERVWQIKNANLYSHLPPHHFKFTLLSSKRIIQTLQMQIQLNTLACSHCHFATEKLFEMRQETGRGWWLPKWLFNSKGHQLAGCQDDGADYESADERKQSKLKRRQRPIVCFVMSNVISRLKSHPSSPSEGPDRFNASDLWPIMMCFDTWRWL